ncbi:alpha/beta fold hydrolase [Kitasatospora sp. NBC_01266]|uniref:alpha/beta fold hydrolase n=1 Tax=Kitasatospora sp. NBC_01266 TaxID=2903572 RepID=UPI002E35FD57|nr:alpha/beta hydrolase [Kitasatospora sp. NBC_01266]
MTTETTTAHVRVSGGTIGVRRHGWRGPTLVFTHYWGGSASTWDAVAELLPADRDTARFDQRGWGSSRRLPGPYHLRQLADDLVDVVTGLGLGSFVLVGHSMGGKVSQLAAARRPPGLAGLVLLAPAPPQPPATVTAEYRHLLSHAYDSAHSVGQSLDQALTAAPLAPPARARAVSDSLAATDLARREWPLRGIAADITDAARLIKAPVLVLAGEHDRVEPVPVLRQHLLPHLPHARLEIVPGSGHLLPLEAPAAVATALTEFTAGLRR